MFFSRKEDQMIQLTLTIPLSTSLSVTLTTPAILAFIFILMVLSIFAGIHLEKFRQQQARSKATLPRANVEVNNCYHDCHHD